MLSKSQAAEGADVPMSDRYHFGVTVTGLPALVFGGSVSSTGSLYPGAVVLCVNSLFLLLFLPPC